jgi:23S rRNA (guanosine2251-2'-O)-methyltransferase
MMPATDKFPSTIPGFHGIREALIRGRSRVRELWLAEGKKSQRTKELIGMAKERGIPVLFVRTVELEKRFPGLVHQGMVAISEPFSYSGVAEIVQRAELGHGTGLVLAADHITDEGNLGALIRAGAFFGAAGLIIPRDRSAQVSPRVIKRSSGAAGMLAVCRVVNLRRALDSLNDQGFWIIGTAGDSPQSIYAFDWKRNLVLVLGNEERGLSPSVRKGCHAVVSIPRFGSMESLNIAVAAGVILGEIRRQQKQ